MTLYFAYGSNMDRAAMKRRCPEARFVGLASLPSHRFSIAASGYATLVPDRRSSAVGLLWEISEADEAALDEYEGVGEGLYRKDRVEVEHEGTIRAAMTYLEREGGKGSPSGNYLATIIAAARAAGLPEDYIETLH